MVGLSEIEASFSGKNVAVTGHTGFKGSWLSLWLHEVCGANVYGFSDRVLGPDSHFVRSDIARDCVTSFGKVQDISVFSDWLDRVKPDYVFHLAAQPIVSIAHESPSDTISSNVIGSSVLMEWLCKRNPETVCVLITSDKCYENKEWCWRYRESDELGGNDIYSISKSLAELMIDGFIKSYNLCDGDKFNFKIARARAGNVIGGGDFSQDRLIPDCYRAWAAGETAIIRSPDSIRPWQHVLDPIYGYMCLAHSLRSGLLGVDIGDAFNFGPKAVDREESVLNVVRRLACSGKSIRDVEVRAGKAIDGVSISNLKEARLLSLDCTKAERYLNWTRKLDFELALKFTSTWYEAWIEQPDSMRNISISQIDCYREHC